MFNKSAFKHSFTEADIEWAFLHPIASGVLNEYENKYILVGFSTVGIPIEIFYIRIDEDKVNVFHTMQCRKEFLPKNKHYSL